MQDEQVIVMDYRNCVNNYTFTFWQIDMVTDVFFFILLSTSALAYSVYSVCRSFKACSSRWLLEVQSCLPK